jgi:hypothetical protein
MNSFCSFRNIILQIVVYSDYNLLYTDIVILGFDSCFDLSQSRFQVALLISKSIKKSNPPLETKVRKN